MTQGSSIQTAENQLKASNTQILMSSLLKFLSPVKIFAAVLVSVTNSMRPYYRIHITRMERENLSASFS